MQEFEVVITETLRMKVVVEAEDYEEAEQIVLDNWLNGEYILDADNFVDVQFQCLPPTFVPFVPGASYA